MNENTWPKWVASLIGTIATYLWGGWDVALVALVVFATFDYITGVTAAWATQRLNSKVGAKGIVRKVGMFVVVAICNVLDGLMGNADPTLRTAAAWWYVGNEALSIIENLAEIGVPIPQRILNALASLKGDEEVRN